MVNKKILSQHRGNLIKTIFTAPKTLTRAFVSVSFFNKFVTATLLILISYYGISPASTIAGNNKKFTPQRETIAVFPSQISSSDWKNVSALGNQDLYEYSLLQDFNESNSAYLDFSESEIQNETTESENTGEVIDSALDSTNATSDSSSATEEVLIDIPSDVTTEETVPEVESEVQLETDTNQEPKVIPEPESTVVPESPISYLKPAAGLFLLAQAEIIEAINLPLEEVVPTSESEPTIEPQSEIIPETQVETIETIETDEIDESEGEILVDANSSRHTITLEGFDIPKLESGHFVDNLQLRLSLAGEYETDLLTAASISVDYSFGEFAKSAGTILLEEEISNAINGGYYLITLPSITDSALLSDLKINITFEGDIEKLNSLFIDSAWLELGTVVYNKQLLEERTSIDKLVHLKGLEEMSFLSDELDFTREENPFFNLRYNSQRNFLIRGLRGLFSNQFAKVDYVTFVHNQYGPIEVAPDISITSDGLVNIVLSDSDKVNLKPGIYKVEISIDEGGYISTDSFEFQWGLLSINTNQTEYTNGDVVKVSMGALSSNGNTVCDANLNLFVTSPSGYISNIPVIESGQCDGNNVIDVPDYGTEFTVDEFGEYELYLERTDEFGEIIAHTYQIFTVVPNQEIVIERNGPTRIFPPAPYAMTLTVHAFNKSFSGEVIERVPNDFLIKNTDAEIRPGSDFTELVWNIDVLNGGSKTVSYEFDAPDISPFLFELGPAKLVAEVAPLNQTEIVPAEVVNEVIPDASSTEPTLVPVEQIILEASSTEPTLPLVETELITPASSQVVVFEESRQWQIASDATGSMLLMWDGASIPTGWTCVSCTGGDVFYQRYIVGSSTAGINGGAATHTHTVPAATVNTTLSAGVSNAAGGGTDAATLLHTHTLATPAIGTANNLPLYRNLVIIQHNSAGEPLSIPTGAIAIFDATVPTGWTQYSAQDGYYVRGESTANIGVTGGSNTHTHTVTGTLSGPTGTTNASNGPTAVATQAHTHTISTSTASDSSEPPYIEAILGKLNATTTLPNDVITMWTDTAPTDWNAVSTTSEPFENRFLKPAATYGTTGGASSHTPANVNGIVSSGPNATNNRQTAGTSDAPGGHTHTVNVTGFSSTTHLPSYRSVIFAKRAGGSPPAAPTIYTLFDNEKTGTTSPELEFSAEDTVGTDSMIYQVQWDDDYDVATSPSGDRTSDIETGCSPNCFENLATPADTNPFSETERVRFTIQDTLTDGVTYYWRVRAIKETGSTWGTWSDIRSFTYVADTDPSQWMQTTDDQFDQGVFSNTETYGSSSVRIIQDIPTEALVAYGEGVITTPRYRIWSGTAWSAEADALDIGGVPQWVRVVPGTTRDEYILGVHDANNDINVQVFDGVSDTWGDLQEVTATANDTARRAFDVTYETNSGDAIVVYCSGTDAAYRTWDGSTWSSATTITTASTNNCNYISVASDPTSDEIVMVARDTSAGTTDYEAFVWSGSAWGNAVTLGSITTTNNEGMSIQYEESGGQAMVVTSNGAGNNFLWMTWNGTEWSTPTTQAVGNDFQWGILKADVGSDKLALCYIDLDTDIGVVRWDGEAWSAFQEFETAGYTSAGRNTSCEFETTSGRDGNIMIPYSDTTNSRYTFWNGTVLSAEASISTITEAWEIGTTRTGDGKILSYFHDSVNTNYDFSYWNGTAWSAVQTLETSASVTANPRRQPVGITAKIFQPSEGTLTSDPVDFDLVSNRTEWGEALWSTTEPIGSEVKIQVLYATSTNNYCDTLIPNGDLAGNSAGFGATSTPLDLSGLSTTTYNKLCLRATISTTNSSIPTLDDWTISWERQPYLVQSAYRWYVNANSEDPSDVWPQGATDLALNESIPIDYSPGSGDVLRLRMAVRSDNATLSASTQAFKLQYAETSGSCTSTTAWIDVGSQSSSTAKWRGYGNLFAFDGSDISTLLLGSDVGGSYEEENDSAVNPNAINVGDEGEWDWVLQHNSATDGVQYCFRMVLDDGTPLDDYEQAPSLLTNASPVAPTLEKLFDNEQVASTTPWFEFVTTDTENDGVSYQVQVDNNYDFSSVALDRNSISNVSEFENIVNLADKDPFTSGQNIQFKPSSALSNNTTYYWRVRAKDIDGSNDWGDWSAVSSFTINSGTTVTTWYQTEQEQFATNNFNDTETTASDDVILTTSFTVGTTTGTSIDYDAKTNGNAWGELSWTDNETLGTVTYRIEYLNAESWELVPDSYLPGNSSGFNASPVSLLGLDPQVHNVIRVRANLVNTTGTPRLLDWKVEWGFAVEQPTLVDLFDNEKTGTTTPTFTFNTTDPDSDAVQYEISWSTDNTFVSGSTTPLSGVSSGFANVTNGGDTSPFNSGDTISYTIQSGDALTNNQTYWWRVRARDPLGGNAWSVWSEARSFTVDTTVTVSTWFQTTDEQFDTSDLTNAETTGSDSVEITSIIREAFTAYAEGTVQTPRYRLWNGSTWSTEASGVSVGGTIRFVESDASSFRDEYMIATQDSTGRVRAQVYDGANQTTGDLTTIVTAVPSTLRQGFDVAYESDSGDALVVACEGTEATYKVWDGSSWSASTAITLAVTANCNWIKLASDPVSDEIILVVRDDTTGATDYEAQVWNGSAWGNSMTMGSMSEVGDEGIAVEYEESGDRAVVVVSNGLAASFAWNSWNGSAWSGAATQAYQDDFENGRLVRDLGSDNMVLCGIDQDTQMHISRWTGSSNTWNAYTTVELTGNAKTGRPMDCVFETTTGRDGYIMIPYSDTTNGRSQFWDGSVLSGEASISTIQDSFEVRSTRTGDGTILAAFYDDINTQYDYSYWNGTAWSTHETLESTAITTTNPPTIPLDIVAREYPTFTEGTVVSDPIVFSEGSGLKWQQAVFTDTTPGASTILYQVEYYNGSTWALIPDAALAGNAAGFNAASIDLSAVSRVIYNTIRLKANLACVGGDCPTLSDWKLEWSAGINVAGTLKQYDQVASTTSGTIAVAINGVLQSGKTAVVSNGAWSIPNVTAFEGDIVTVFVSGAADSAEAVSVTRYDGDGDIAGFTMFERHLALGSNDATSTPLTNADVGMFDYTNTEDIFFNVSGTTLSVCSDTGCGESELYIKSGVYYTPAGRIVTNDFENNGIFTAGTYTHEVNGSWDNNATTTMTGSTILFAATSTTETIDNTGAVAGGFNNVTFGTTTGNGTWNLSSTLDVNGALTVTRGTLARGSTEITVAGNVLTEANGFWTGTGTTTFDGSTAATWRNQNATIQNIGRVVVDGTSKAVTLASNVAAESITIGANDTLDASVSNYDITVYDSWINQNNFVARSGEVLFAAGSSGKTITTAGDAFYDLSFTGVGGGYSFTEATLLVNNNVSIATGTVTMPTGTTTIAGSFNATGGTFAHNNGVLSFTAGTAKTITFAGGAFTNTAYNLFFNGAGSWTITDTNATSSNDVTVRLGTLNFPSGTMAIGGSLADTGGTYAGGTGKVLFYSSVAEVLTVGGSSYNDVEFSGTGSWSFSDGTAAATGDLIITQGTLTLPTGTFTLGGSYTNNATVVPGTGTLSFNSTDSGETINFGSSSLYNVNFNSSTGGWTITNSATTTNNFNLTALSDWTLASGQTLSVGGVFTNSVGGASTTWTGSTLDLNSGTAYSINTSSSTGEVYNILQIAANTDVKMWNSSAATYTVNASGSLYSQDQAGVNGDLYIWGDYVNNSGNEYWSYATDFDGTNLSGSERQVDVRLASGAKASVINGSFNVLGGSSASTTINNQGSGTYTIDVSGGTSTLRYYDFSNLGTTGLSFLNSAIVSVLRDGSYNVAAPGGTALTLASTTIDANPNKQIFGVTFATSSAIAAYNVSQTDGTPSSYWWFRESAGNLDGEANDNDTGDPGSVRWDDSSLTITISGTVYSDAGVTPIIGGTCNGSAPVVKVVVNGGSSYTGSCSNIDGTFSISGVVITGDPTLTIYLDGASGGEKGTVITRTPTANITNLDIYANRVIVRNEDVAATTIENLAVYDSADDADLQFTAATSTNPDTLTVMANSELFVFASSTFAPGGEVTLQANATANSYDGTLYLDDNATFTGSGTSTYSIGGRLVLDSNAVFSAASSTVLMTATTTGKSITSSAPITFNDLVFNGVGGGWNLGADIVINGDMTITNGTVTGTGNISLETGSLTGDGILSLGAGTTTIKTSNTLGGNSAWTFYNLTLGNASQVGTTTPVFTATTTVAGKLTIQTAHYLAAGSTKWDLSGTGTVFVETGTFVEGASTVRYSGAGANVLSTQYYNLDINSGAGSQTYTATGLGIIVDNDLTIGGAAGSILNLNTNDPLFDVNGDLTIHSNGTLSASNSGTLTIAGNYENNGAFTGNGGTITFNGSVTSDIAAGSSSFSSVLINATGDITISESATTTATFNLLNANSFTLNSGQTLAVSGNFYNNLGGAATVWTGSTLNLSGGNNYSINTSTTSDSYATIDIDGTTQIRMWNSEAGVYSVDSTASLYSQDQAGVNGDLYIWGDYRKTTGTDYWSYDTDFDGTSLSGSGRKVDVYFNSGSSATISGGAIYMIGTSSASTTVQNQGAGTYGLLVGGNALASFSNYEIRDINSSGLVFSGTPTIVNISRGNLEVSQTGGSAITVGGTVITQNPAKTFTDNRFALNGAASGFNVTATGTTLSSWRFTNYTGDISGEGFDVDPDGDPGYIVWDDSAANITISGTVYSDDGSTTMGAAVCDSSRNAVRIVVAGLTTYNTSCATGTGIYSISGISFSPGDSVIAYILPASTEVGATVTVDPGSNINNFDIYQNRVIVRHEGVSPITIADLAVWDSSDDANIPFTAVDAGTDTLTLPANRKLIVWTGKEFEPTGNVTISGGGVGAAYDGTLELFTNAIWTGQGTESLAVGGSMLLGSGATFTSSNGTTTFTTTGASRTIDVNESAFGNISFTGSGSWSITDPTVTFNGNFSMTNGSLTMPTGTSTFNGSLVNAGGSFAINGSQSVFTGASSKVITLGSSDLAAVKFSGGNYSFTETNATTTGDFIINSGTITLPSGNLVVGGNFRNISGAITHNTSEIILTNPTSATVLASSSDLYGVTFRGGGNYSFEDTNLTLLDRLLIQSGNITLASGTLSIGGSFDASGGTFANATGTLLFNSGDTGEYIDAGNNNFYNVVISSPAGGYTLIANATTTNNFSLSSASSFTVQTGVTLAVNGVFQNLVGGANTNWTGSTLYLNGNNSYEVNTKVSGGDQYNNLTVGPNSDISFWNSAATTTNTDLTSSIYSQDNAGVNGALFIYGDYHISTTTEYWSYATDFDGTSLSGSERIVTVQMAANATTTVDGGSLQIIGTSGNRTTLTNQGSGTYALNVSAGTINALYYTIRNMNSNGLNLTGSPTVTSLSYGNYELAVASGSLISLASSALNANASLVIIGNNFSTTTAISGYNVNLTGSTSNAWTFTSHSGNLDGEDFDIDGGDACGSIRWSDSACLLTQQTQYRWRNDDGGLGVPDSEWYDTNWLARKRVKVDNQDSTTYTDAAVKLLVTYDSDMQADFDDLHFTSSDGVTSIPHWFGSTTDSAIAEVWVKVPSLPADDTATLFMYYSNPTATSSASSTATFIAADDFEDGNITEYSGQTTLFTAGTSFNYNLSYGLDNAGNETGRANTGGIYRLDQTVSQGETFRYLQYIDTAGTSDETCTKFGIQGSNVPNNNYAICVELPGTDHISLVRNAIDNEASASLTLASSTISLTTGWYEFEVDWGTDNSLFVSVFNSAGSLAASMSASDSNYTTGGFGFTYWFNQGGWDAVSSRPTLTTEPTIIFGAEQVDGGATWKGAQNTPVSYGIDDIARLRVVVENSGLNIINQQLLLEYAPIGAAPSCEAVSPASFVTVPIQASCGTSPICMQSTTYFTNNDATVDLLFGTAGTFVAGEAIENPSDKTNNLNINQDYYTEIEYAITPTINTVDESLCFRVTNDGTDLDTYLKVAQMDLRFDPVVTGVSLNNGGAISLIPGTTTTVYATGTVTDLNGFADIVLASSTIYRSGVSGGAACTPNNNDCYISTSPSKCEFTNCSGNSCTVECRADIYFHADPTDLNSPHEGEEWLAMIEVEDASTGYDFGSAIGVEMKTLRAIDVQGAIDYGALAVNTDTGSFNASTTVLNQGNVNINIEILGTDLTDGASSTIPAEQQKFATSTFTYSGCTTCDVLSSSTPVLIDVDLGKPTIDTPPVTDDVYWGIRIPISGINSVPHQGINVFTPVSP